MSSGTIAYVACLLLISINSKYVSASTSQVEEVYTSTPARNNSIYEERLDLTARNSEANESATILDESKTAISSPTENVSRSISLGTTISSTTSSEDPTTTLEFTTTLSPEMNTVRKWENMEKSLNDLIASVMKWALSRMMESRQNINISRKCMNGLFQLVGGVTQMKPWAFYMLDAMGKPLAGTLAGSVSSFGSFDECVNIVVNKGKRNEFQGQYCAMEIKPPLPPKPRFYKMRETLRAFANFSTKKDTIIRDISKIAHLFYSIPFRMDLCVPSVCSKEDVSNIVHGVIGEDTLEAKITRCELKEEWKVERHQIIIICIFSLIALMVAIGSVLETVYLYKGDSAQDYCDKSTRAKILLSFSIYSNTRKLFDTNVTEERLLVIYGLKAFSMMWMIWSNVYFSTERLCFRLLTSFYTFAGFKTSGIGKESTLRQMIDFPKSGLFQALINFSLSVDNLYFTSAVVVGYMNVKLVDKYNKKFNIISFVLRRIWRTIPSLMLLISLSLLVPILGSGPLWNDIMGTHVNKCKEYWWTNLALINNFYPKPSQNCFMYSPYYAADVQLYIVSIMVLVPLLKYRSMKGAIFFILLFVIGSILSTSILTYSYNLPPTVLFTYLDPDDLDEVLHLVTLKPFCHMGSFFIGIALGCFLYKNRDLDFKSKYHFFGWPAALAGSMAVLFGVHQWNLGNLPNDSVGSLYSGFHRTVWSLTLAWFTAACFYGTGGVFRKIFTWRALVPLSRMTFVAFIIQYIVLLVICGFLRERIQPNHTIAIFMACGMYVLTYFVSYVCYISFDGPIESLKSLIFDNKKKAIVELYVNGSNDAHVKDAGVKSYDLYKINSEA